MFSAKQFLAFQYVFKMSWQAKNFYAEDVFKTCSRHLFGRSLRHFGDKKKSLQGGNLKKSLNLNLTNLYVTSLYLANLRRN